MVVENHYNKHGNFPNLFYERSSYSANGHFASKAQKQMIILKKSNVYFCAFGVDNFFRNDTV